MKTLALAQEAEQLRVDKTKLEIKQMTQKHELEVKFLLSKLEIDGGQQSIVVCTQKVNNQHVN